MGTSMAFYHVMNTGFSREALAQSMKKLSGAQPSGTGKFGQTLLRFLSPGKATQSQIEADEANARQDDGFDPGDMEGHAVIAYSAAAKWFPLFDEQLCEECNASDGELRRVYKVFAAPILAFVLYDSDVLLVSYIDDKQHTHHAIKSNFEPFEEYNPEAYSTEFPAFLLPFCDAGEHETLRGIWNRNDYVFADNRMHDICNLLGISPLYSGSEKPDGYRPIYG